MFLATGNGLSNNGTIIFGKNDYYGGFNGTLKDMRFYYAN